MMFSEWVFNSKDDLDKVCQSINNNNVTALFELKLPGKGLERNHLFLLQKGKIIDLRSHQIISLYYEATEENIDKLIKELELCRQFEVNGKRFLIIQCGENFILK